MIYKLLPLLALPWASASPLNIAARQAVSSISSVADASSIVGEASSIVASATDAATATTSMMAPSSAGSASMSGSAITGITSGEVSVPTQSASSPVVTMYPSTSNGEAVVVNGQRSPLVPVDTYLGIPFAEPRTSCSFHMLFVSRKETLISSQLLGTSDSPLLRMQLTTRPSKPLPNLLHVFSRPTQFRDRTTRRIVFI